MTEIGMLHGYIGIIMDELKAHRLPVPPTSHIPSKDPLIQRNEPKYMPVPLGLTDSQGFFPFDAWAQGSVPGQAPFQASGYVPDSLADWAGPSTDPLAGDDDGNNAKRFTSDIVRDDDSPQVQPCIVIS